MRKIGIEIENESLAVSVMDAQSYLSNSSSWVVEQDGSLRGGAHGWEIKTAGSGLSLSRALASLNELYPVMSDSSGVWRAAVHVHVDANDMTWEERATALCMAYVFDRSIFALVSPERVESNFCVPLDQKAASVFTTVRNMLCADTDRIGYGKYSSVNSDSLLRFGTFEFRHMRTPRCDSTIASVREALDAIASFATLAHGIIDTCKYASLLAGRTDTSPEDRVRNAVLALVGMAQSPGSLFPSGLVADPVAVLDVLSFLGCSPADSADVDYGSLLMCVTVPERRMALRRRAMFNRIPEELEAMLRGQSVRVEIVEEDEEDWHDEDHWNEEEDI